MGKKKNRAVEIRLTISFREPADRGRQTPDPKIVVMTMAMFEKLIHFTTDYWLDYLQKDRRIMQGLWYNEGLLIFRLGGSELHQWIQSDKEALVWLAGYYPNRKDLEHPNDDFVESMSFTEDIVVIYDKVSGEGQVRIDLKEPRLPHYRAFLFRQSEPGILKEITEIWDAIKTIEFLMDVFAKPEDGNPITILIGSCQPYKGIGLWLARGLIKPLEKIARSFAGKERLRETEL